MDVSLVIPAFNEAKNIEELIDSITHTMVSLSERFTKHGYVHLVKQYKTYEIIVIDDGSTDNTFQLLQRLRKKTSQLRIIKFRKNFGQTAALNAGFNYGKGDVFISLDADLQNDPRDIPRLLMKLDEGYDVVSGWRKNRHDTFSKVMVSKFASALRTLLIKDPIHDYGCTLKAYKRECFDEITLFGEMHRYIPAILRWKGFKLGEIKVKHHPRKHGLSKYGMNRISRGFLDMINVWFWRKFSSRPLHIFGGLGILCNMVGSLCILIAVYQKIFRGNDLSDTFLTVVGVFGILVGVQLFVSGILADILIKIYYKGNTDYSIEMIIG